MNNLFENYGEATVREGAPVNCKPAGINKDMLMIMAMSGGNMGEMNPMMLLMMGGQGGLQNMKANNLTSKFLPQEIQGAGMSFNGDIVLDGKAIKFDEENNAMITTTEGLQLDMPLLSMPAKLDDIEAGDIVEVGGAFIAVKKVNDNKIVGLDIRTSNTVSHQVTNSAFGMANVRKVFNPFGSNGQMDPMMLMLLMA